MLKVEISRKGRKCKFYGCKHILSVYNHDAYCSIHINVIKSKNSFNTYAKLIRI